VPLLTGRFRVNLVASSQPITRRRLVRNSYAADVS
jgi:hypothetical protein